MLRRNRDRDLGPAIASPYVLGDEKAPGPHVRTSKWLEMAAGHQRKLVPIRQVRSRPRAEPASETCLKSELANSVLVAL